jgi:membrane fusion protein (multidrug efflux system)
VPSSFRPIKIIAGAAPLLAALMLAGCGGGKPGGPPGGPGGPGGAPKSVGFVTVAQSDVAMETELPGRTAPYRISDVRPQITGILRRRLFTEGALVKAGQPLYEIEPAPYRAAAAEAEANLQSARASAEAAREKAERYRPLVEINAISKQDYTDAQALARQTAAAVAQRQAQLETARINLRYTSVPAPISGRIGRSLVTDGALVTANQATALAQINQLDPIYVDIQQSAADLIALRRALGGKGGWTAGADVRLRLEDGSDYGITGHVGFAETIVDPATGTVTLRALFPNPDGLLLPGMFVRARFAQSVEKGVVLVPQPAVSRDQLGAPQIWVVGKDEKGGDKAEQRAITVSRTHGSDWVVTSGVKAGERVIVQGTGNLRPDQAIKPVPADAPQRVAPPGQGSGPGGGGPGGNGSGGAARPGTGG